jgi:hypothetical protein
VSDVVRFNNSSYIATAATSAGESPTSAPAKWSLMAQEGAQGQQGIQGNPGIQGTPGTPGTFSTANVTVRTATMNGTSATGQANCTGAEKALGGGFDVTGAGGNNRPIVDAPVVSGTTPTGWKFTWSVAVSGTVYAICVS